MLPDFLSPNGIQIVISAYVPEGEYLLLDGIAHFHSREDLDRVIRAMNRSLRCRQPTKAMKGNARRRALLAIVEAETDWPFNPRYSRRDIERAKAKAKEIMKVLGVI